MWFWTGIKLPQTLFVKKKRRKEKEGIWTAIKSLIPVNAEMTSLNKVKDKSPEFNQTNLQIGQYDQIDFIKSLVKCNKDEA